MAKRYAVGKHESRSFGFEHERDILGAFPVNNPDYVQDLKKIGTHSEKSDILYVPYDKSIELIKKHQPWDPTNPRNEFLRELRLELYDKLHLDPHELPDAIKMYTALGTPLDRYHGSDGFVSLSMGKQETLAMLDAS